MAKFTELVNKTTLFADGCNAENYRLKGLRDIDPSASDNIMPLLQEKHPHLTDAQHHERILTAMHEAAHLTVAVALRTYELGPYGFIRVPKRSSANTRNNNRGIAGRITCGSSEQSDDVIISLAGYALSRFITNDAPSAWVDDERQALSGIGEISKRYNEASGIVLTVDEKRDLEYHYRDCALRLVVLHLPVIEKVATAALLLCDRNGDINGKRWYALIEFVQNELKNQQAFYEYRTTRAYRADAWIYNALSAKGMGSASYMPDGG